MRKCKILVAHHLLSYTYLCNKLVILDERTTNTTLEATTEPVQTTEKSGETDNDSDNDDDDDNDDDTQEKEKVLDDPSKPLRERGIIKIKVPR